VLFCFGIHPLTVAIINPVQSLKAMPMAYISAKYADRAGWGRRWVAILGFSVRCAFSGRNLQSMMPNGSHAYSLEMNMRMTNGIPLR
jgi:hypothetical protein